MGEHALCPFCGTSALNVKWTDQHIWAYCEMCDAAGPRIARQRTGEPDDEEIQDAWDRWDERAT